MSVSTLSTGAPRKFPRIKLVWGKKGTIAAEWRFGLCGFYERIHGFPYSGFAISLRGLLAWTLVFAVLSYFAVAGAATYWFRRNPYTTITYSEVLTWPLRREEVARLRAKAWLAQGAAGMKAGRWGEGTFYLRRGLETVPEDFESRAALSSFYVAIGDRARALNLIEDGLKYNTATQPGIEGALNVATAGDDWEIALRICDGALRQFQAAGKWTDTQWVLGRKLDILNQTGRAAEALPLAEAGGDNATVTVKIERARALVALGRAKEADALLSRWRASTLTTNDSRLLLREQVAVRRAAADYEGMDRALTELRDLAPGQPGPVAWAVEQRARARRQGTTTLDDYIFRYGVTAENLMLVARPLATIPDFALLQRVIEAAQERGYDLRPFRMLLGDSRIAQGDTAGFLAVVEDLKKLPPRGGRDFALWFEWARLLADAITSPQATPADSLIAFMRGRPLGLRSHIATVAALKRAGKFTSAREVLVLSRRLYPNSQPLQADETEVTAAIAAAAAAAAAAVPVAEAVKVAPDWNAFIEPVDAAVNAGKWDEARRLVRQLRQVVTAPAWLADRDAELVLRELRIAHALQDSLGVQLATRAYVNGSLSRSNEILALVREWQAAGATNDATFMVRVVLEKSPEHALAKKQLQELTKKK
jgi:tetratricopeptide (TPR) repeat protein